MQFRALSLGLVGLQIASNILAWPASPKPELATVDTPSDHLRAGHALVRRMAPRSGSGRTQQGSRESSSRRRSGRNRDNRASRESSSQASQREAAQAKEQEEETNTEINTLLYHYHSLVQYQHSPEMARASPSQVEVLNGEIAHYAAQLRTDMDHAEATLSSLGNMRDSISSIHRDAAERRLFTIPRYLNWYDNRTPVPRLLGKRRIFSALPEDRLPEDSLVEQSGGNDTPPPPPQVHFVDYQHDQTGHRIQGVLVSHNPGPNGQTGSISPQLRALQEHAGGYGETTDPEYPTHVNGMRIAYTPMTPLVESEFPQGGVTYPAWSDVTQSRPRRSSSPMTEYTLNGSSDSESSGSESSSSSGRTGAVTTNPNTRSRQGGSSAQRAEHSGWDSDDTTVPEGR